MNLKCLMTRYLKVTASALSRMKNIGLGMCARSRCRIEFKVGEDIAIQRSNSSKSYHSRWYHVKCFKEIHY